MAQRSKRKKREAASRPTAQPSPTPQRSAPLSPRRIGLIALQAAVLIGLGVWIYWPSLHGLWLWDDDFLLQNNPTVHDPNGLWYIWSEPQQALIDFFPLTVSFEWLIWQIWTPDNSDPTYAGMTVYYHVTSLIMHLISALLIWHLFRRMGIRLAWLGALIFTIHPVIVESVSWMAELKNTLAMPPFLLAVSAWISFDRTRRWEYYVLSFFLYVIALLFKTSVVMFPIVIMLYAWWKHGRVGFWNNLRSWTDFEARVFRAILEFIPVLIPTIPFLIIAAADAYLLIIYLRHGVGEQFIPGLLGGPIGRTACAGLSLIFYFSKCILPINLLPIYPQWVVTPPSFTLEYVLKFLPWAVIAFGFWWLLKRREQPWARAAIFGFGYFFLMIVPFVGWRAISFMRFGWVMDHFLYVPILGLIGLAAAAAGDIYDRLPRANPVWRIAAICEGIVVLALFSFGSHSYAEVFVDRLAYWTYCAEHNYVAWPAHNNRGNQLLEIAQQEELRSVQVENEAKAAQLAGRATDAQNLTDLAQKEFTEAQTLYQESEAEFKIALMLNPVYTEAHNNLGFILSRQGHYKEAEAEFREALKYTPDFQSAQMNLAQVLRLETAQLQNK